MDGLFWDYSTGTPVPVTTGRGGDESRIEQLEDRVDQLVLTCLAMWSLIQEETRLTEEDLLERVKAIDLMDGTGDGKVTRHVAKCGKCERPMSPRHPRCIYCGHERLVMTAFDSLT